MTATPIALTKQYIEQHEGSYRLIGSRVSLDSIAYAFKAGRSPEQIVHSFPTLALEQVYGAIAFYLANQDAIDAYLEEGEAEYTRLREASRQNDAGFYAKLAAARAEDL